MSETRIPDTPGARKTRFIDACEWAAQGIAWVAYAATIAAFTIPALIIHGLWYAVRDLVKICDETLKVAQ